jgi:pimeloyl-ACP methyl ester carboxylesterase
MDEEFKVSLRLLTQFSFIEPLKKIADLEIPLQIFHGTKDNLVPFQVAQKIKVDYPFVDVRILNDMGHGLYLDGDDEGVSEGSLAIQKNYYSSVLEFLTKGMV